MEPVLTKLTCLACLKVGTSWATRRKTPAAPGDVFADLEAEGDLLYVTGFDQGVQVYDPNGLSFLNTWTEMRNGFGYWVKSAVATEGDVLAPLSDDVLPARSSALRRGERHQHTGRPRRPWTSSMDGAPWWPACPFWKVDT